MRGTGAIVSVTDGADLGCLAMKKAAMNAAIILNMGKGLEVN